MSSLQTSRRLVSDIRLRSSDRYNNVTNTNTGQWQLTSDQPAPAAWSEEIRGEIQLQRPGQPEWPGAANSYENKQENVGKLSVPGQSVRPGSARGLGEAQQWRRGRDPEFSQLGPSHDNYAEPATSQSATGLVLLNKASFKWFMIGG